MSQPLLITGFVSLYLATGLVLAGLSMHVWRASDSSSWLAKALFPWNAHDECVGAEASFSICGSFLREDPVYLVLYIGLMALGWPMKIFWCFCTKVYVTFFYH